jgi:phosphate starvation-inducible protein PhoH and related proteins
MTLKRSKRSTIGDRPMIDATFVPESDAQKKVQHLWPKTQILCLLGHPRSGKTHSAFALALRDKRRPIWLMRPTVACGESLGFEPGDINEKLKPWLMPFEDVLTGISFVKMSRMLESEEVAPVSMAHLRGRTVRGTLIVDEAQNLSYNQLKCVLTRLVDSGKVVLCGDPGQSDLGPKPPILKVVQKLQGVEGVEVVWFKEEDCKRSEIVKRVAKLV